MMAEIEAQYTISDALTSLGGMMRYSLKWTSHHVRLKDEIGHIRNYIAIMNIRYDHRLELVLDIPAAYLDQEVLKMSLQPIIENAVKHGMRLEQTQKPKMTITIRAYTELEDMMIEIEDDGIGMSSRKLSDLNQKIQMDEADYQYIGNQITESYQEGSGIGLRNVNQRISMFYGKDYGIRVESKEGSSTLVIMSLPYFMLSGGLSAHAQTTDRR
jgi:two-component system sensor histidine kinase YesM